MYGTVWYTVRTERTMENGSTTKGFEKALELWNLSIQNCNMWTSGKIVISSFLCLVSSFFDFYFSFLFFWISDWVFLKQNNLFCDKIDATVRKKDSGLLNLNLNLNPNVVKIEACSKCVNVCVCISRSIFKRVLGHTHVIRIKISFLMIVYKF